MFTRRRRGSNKQKGGKTRYHTRSYTARTQSQRTKLETLKEEDLNPDEKKLLEIFIALPEKIKNTFIQNKKILIPNLRQRAIFDMAMKYKKGKVAPASPVVESPYRNE